jgi:branched-chain amino acid transport system permease protein
LLQAPGMKLLLELTFQGVLNGSIYALIAVGLVMVYGLLRVLHIAHAGMFTLGAYIGLEVTNATGSLALAMICSVVTVGIAGVAIYRLCYEPILNKPPYVILIVSIGLFIAMEEVFRIVFGPYGLSYTHPPLQTRLDILGFSVKTAEIFVIAAVLFLFGALDVFTRFTRIGIASRATVTDQQMAASFGADVRTIRDITFFIGSGFAAVAGTMVGVLNNIVEPTMGSVPSYKALAIIVLGGLGSIRGALLASLFLGLIEAFGTTYLGFLLDRDAIAFAVMLVVLMLRPAGLTGR